MAYSISKVSTAKPGNVSLKRGSGDTMDVKWTIPYEVFDHFDWTDLEWTFNASKNMAAKFTEVREGKGHVTADKLWIRGVGTEARSFTQDYDRKKYHPLTLDRYLTSVKCRVMINPSSYKIKGYVTAQDTNRYSTITYTFAKPDAPKWAVQAQLDNSTSNVSCTLTAASDSNEKEVYDTYYCVTRQDSFTDTYKNEVVVEPWTSTRESSVEVVTDKTPEARSLTGGQWIRIKFKAYSRGIAGNSSTVTREFVISRPNKPTITGITVSNVNDNAGLVTVRFNTNASSYHLVDVCQLQRLTDTTIDSVSGAENSMAWVNVDNASDDGTCSGLTDIVGNARPSRGKHVWYRVATTRASYVQYTTPVKVPELERTSTPVSDDVVTISSVTPGDDGESLIVVLGWSNDDSNGTEITWSDKSDAWYSTEQPSVYNVPDAWKDETSQVTGKPNSAKLVIRGLEVGTQYYIKARRYLEDGDTIEYADAYCTPPSNQYPIKPSTKPTDVTLKAPSYIKRGADLELSWTYNGVSDQTSWNLYKVIEDGNNVTNSVLASGDDAMGFSVIPTEKLGTDTLIKVFVSITTGGDWAESAKVIVSVADPPSIVAVTDSELLSQPMQIYVGTNCSTANLIAKVCARGVFTGTPDGETTQVRGDVVWSGKSTPDWYEALDGLFYTIVTLPKGLSFIDGAEYELQATVEDPTTFFTSETAVSTFTVNWAHTARAPGDATRITAVQDSKSVRISPSKPENWVAGDVYDVYRVTNDTIDKIAEGVEYGSDVIDRYAPFGKKAPNYYRVVNRTKDGGVEWRDIPYSLSGYQLRFDWGDYNAVELPYNLSLSDSYDKNYETHQHIDGSRSGHWNPGVAKKGSFTTKLIKLDTPEQIMLVRDLGSYPGPVFARTPDGSAFQANVTVKQISSSYDDLLLGVSIEAEALTLTPPFTIGANDVIVLDETEQPEEPTYERAQILVWNATVPVTGATYTLNEAPVGNVFKVELSTSYDNYIEPWTLPAGYNNRTVVLGTFGASLQQYLAKTSAVSGTKYLIKAYYNITEEESEETTEES